MRFEFTEAYHAATNVTGEKEIIRLSVGDSNRVKSWEVPQVTIGVSHEEQLLLHVTTMRSLPKQRT